MRRRQVQGVTVVTEDEYAEATEMSLGWCRLCHKFTREATEPDAEDYKCPDCEEMAVIGAENALVEGLIDLE